MPVHAKANVAPNKQNYVILVVGNNISNFQLQQKMAHNLKYMR